MHNISIKKPCSKVHFWVSVFGKWTNSAVSSPLDRSKSFTLFASPGRPVHSDTNSASPGSILARQQLRAKAKSLTFPPLSIDRYSFIQLSEQGRQWRERKCSIFEAEAKRDSKPGSLDCESGILPLSYRAPHVWCCIHVGLRQLPKRDSRYGRSSLCLQASSIAARILSF